MCNSRALVVPLYLLFLHSVVAQVFAQGSSPWKTLNGNKPQVIARGGFSGLFPDSSSIAYSLAVLTSVPDVVLWCDVQLTKDNFGICFPDINLQNASDISSSFQTKNNKYLVNGVLTKGWFSVDFTLKDLANVFLNQGVYSRTNKFDGNLFPILTVQDLVKDLVKQLRPPGLWLNIQHDAFYAQHNLSMRSFVLSVSRSVIVNYISSPEVNFLKSISARFSPRITKLVFRFLEQNEIEPSTNQTYGSLLKNLTFIKTFSSGILVPKSYIWPVAANLYLQPHTSLVSDAHKEGLEVFASNFVNDVPLSYNYSYDPIAEYLSFIDNGDFSVDGVLSDFPITPSAARDCFSHLDKNAKPQAKPLVISKCGASGDYPGCTDLAYTKAISDDVDVLDCPVQMSKDGTPFCLSSINLIESTNVVQSSFGNLAREIPGILPSGIFAFDLTWSQIQGLIPAISNPYAKFTLSRNPNFKNSGNFTTLYEFLALTKNTTSLSGILISIEYAAYLADHQGLSVTDKVLEALGKAGYDNQTAQKVMIQSSNSSVLMKLREKSNHTLVYKVDESIRDALDSTVLEIKRFADSVVVSKESVYPTTELFITTVTNVVPRLQQFKLPVYVETFSNEFLSQAWDFLSDPTVEINSFVMGANIDGVVTDFPKTSAKYKRNKCLGLGNKTPSYMLPIEPGSLMQLITYQYLPPAESPLPVLQDSDVVEPPLPSAKSPTPTPRGLPTLTPAGGAPPPSDAQPRIAACIFLSSLALLAALLLL